MGELKVVFGKEGSQVYLVPVMGRERAECRERFFHLSDGESVAFDPAEGLSLGGPGAYL